MYQPKQNPTVSAFSYALFCAIHEYGGFDTNQKGFAEYVKNKGADYSQTMIEIESTGLVENSDGILLPLVNLFCAEIRIYTEIEYVVGDQETNEAFNYAVAHLKKWHEVGVDITVKVFLGDVDTELVL